MSLPEHCSSGVTLLCQSRLSQCWGSPHVTGAGRNIYNWIFGDILVLRNCYQPRSHTGEKTNNSRAEERREEGSHKIRNWLKKTGQLVSRLVVVQFSNWPDVSYDDMTRPSQAKCCSTYFPSHSWYCQPNTWLGCRFGSLKLAMFADCVLYQLPTII